jgi:hypothetical protein
MSTIPSEERVFGLRRDFVNLCREVSVVDKSHHWVHIDRLWWEVDTRTRFSRIVAQYLRLLLENYSPEQTIIVTPDTISSSFGITPLVFIAGQGLGYPVAIWQEIGDFATNKSILIGTRRSHLKCLVLQDVIRHGTTILKMLGSFTERQWDLTCYACLALNCRHHSLLERTKQEYRERTGRELDMQYLVTADTLI